MIMRRTRDAGAQVVVFGILSPAGLCVEDYPIVGGAANDLFPWPNVQDDTNVFGARAVEMPGVVAGMGLAHRTWGTQPWADLLAPAIAEARAGLHVDWYAQLVIASAAAVLARYPASRATFLDAQGFPKSSAWTALGQTRCDLSPLATTLEGLARNGADDFYRGALAEKLVIDLQAEGGCHTADDFASYQARIVDASEVAYRGHRVFSTPKLTAGPTMEHVLEQLADWQPQGASPDAAAYTAYDRAIRVAKAQRLATMGDVEHELAPSCTTHFNVVDREGTTVAVTQTLLSMFGSQLMLPGSGVLMNNGIMWFDPEPGKPNSIGPAKRCLSNMVPTLLEHRDGRRLAPGGAGGRKIMPAVAQLVSFLLDYDLDIETAMHAPRIDSSTADVTIADQALSMDILSELAEALPSLVAAPRSAYPFNFACPGLAEHGPNGASAVAETMAPWAEAVAV